jgi:hypothetical protein
MSAEQACSSVNVAPSARTGTEPRALSRVLHEIYGARLRMVGIAKMDRLDRELLDKQLRRLQPPRRNDGAMALVGVALFLAGMTLGSFLFAYKSQPTRTAANDATSAFSLSHSTPTIRR